MSARWTKRIAGLGALTTTLAAVLVLGGAGCERVGTATTEKGPAGDGKAPEKKKQAKPPLVRVARPTEAEVQDHEEFTGRTEAMQTVEVRAHVTGYLDKIHFTDGEEVDEGDVLFEIDPRQYQAELDRARSAVRQAEAKQKRTELVYRRVAALFAKNAASREELDLAEDDYAEAQASVGVASAQRDLAELNRDYTRVTAPIAGRISRRMVDVGNLVKADDTILTTIVNISKLYIYYDVDDRTVLKVRRLVREDAFASLSEGEAPVEVALVDQREFDTQGVVDFYESKLDPNTGTLRVRAVIDNPVIRAGGQRTLSPGLFVRVRLPMGPPFRALTIPEEALNSDQGKKYIFVFEPNGATIDPGTGGPVQREGTVRIVRERETRGDRAVGDLVLGPLRDGRRVVRSGLDLNAEVIVQGVQALKAGGKARASTEEGTGEDTEKGGGPP